MCEMVRSFDVSCSKNTWLNIMFCIICQNMIDYCLTFSVKSVSLLFNGNIMLLVSIFI